MRTPRHSRAPKASAQSFGALYVGLHSSPKSRWSKPLSVMLELLGGSYALTKTANHMHSRFRSQCGRRGRTSSRMRPICASWARWMAEAVWQLLLQSSSTGKPGDRSRLKSCRSSGKTGGSLGLRISRPEPNGRGSLHTCRSCPSSGHIMELAIFARPYC